MNESINNIPIPILPGEAKYLKSLPAQLPKLRFLDVFMAGHSGFIAGGCFKNLFLGEKIKDVDIFFGSQPDAELGIEYFKKSDEFTLAYENARVIAFRHVKIGIIAELITAFLLPADELIKTFDFSITKAAYYKAEDGSYEFIFHERFFEHLTNKKLVIDDKIPFPLSTFNRSYRYMKYGFGLCAESKQKLVASLQGIVNPQFSDFYFGID